MRSSERTALSTPVSSIAAGVLGEVSADVVDAP
jgi:hypothetical protein